MSKHSFQNKISCLRRNTQILKYKLFFKQILKKTKTQIRRP